MSFASTRMDYDSSNSTSSPSPVQVKDMPSTYRECQYRNGSYCCSKICTIVVLLIFTTLASLTLAGLSVWLDNWAGMSTNPYATLDLPYPRLGPKYLDYIMFNETIPNDEGTLYKYVDTGDSVQYLTSRYGLLSNCKVPVNSPKISLFMTPWSAPTCKAGYDEYQCPIVAMRIMKKFEPKPPRIPTYREAINGCIKKDQVCDGVMDCPTGHDELNCPQIAPCGPGMIQCGPNKPICISKSQVCNGMNDCGMYEDEQNCCGRAGFLRCADGTCVMGDRCDANADCFDLSDEYDCPNPSSDYYSKCNDGQLIESTHMCEMTEYASFQCKDFSDETMCAYEPQPLKQNPAAKSLAYNEGEKCFKQSFTFEKLNETTLTKLYQDASLRKFARDFEYSPMKLAIVALIGACGFLCVVALVLLVCVGNVLKRCKQMRCVFLILSALYLVCIIQTLISGIYWVKYANAKNEGMESATSTDMYNQVAIETLRVTGGLASIRISTQLTFYNCGFFGLAMLLCLIAAHIIKSSSCHTSYGYTLSQKFSRHSDEDQFTATGLLLGRPMHDMHDGIATPDQIVTPQRSVKSLDGHILHSNSESALRSPSFFTGSRNGTYHGGSNTYVSYKDIDAFERAERLSQQLMVRTLDRNRTLDRGTVKSTQV